MDAENYGLADVEAPAVARRRVRLALRRARDAKQLTQTQVANAMQWSLSKIMRIEKGQVNVAPSDLTLLLRYLDITDPDEVQQLVLDARVSRKERYSGDAQFRKHFTPAMRQLYQFEAAATAVRIYQDKVIPGHLQTEGYARAIFDTYLRLGPPHQPLDPATVDARVQVRLQRQRSLFEPDGTTYQVVLDESVLQRPIGGAQTMAAQLRLLLEIMANTTVRLRIIPFETAASTVQVGPFMVIDLGDGKDPVLYREAGDQDSLLQSQSEAARHDEIFRQLWGAALGEADTRHMIERRIDDLS